MNRRAILRLGALAALLAGAVTLAFVAPAVAGISASAGSAAAPGTSVAPTDVPPTDVPPTSVPPTDVPPTGDPTDPAPLEEVVVFCPIADESALERFGQLNANEDVCFEATIKVEIKDGKPYVKVVPVDGGPTVEGKPTDPTKLAVGGFTRDFDKGKATIELVATCTKGNNSTKYNVKVEVEWTELTNPQSSSTVTKVK